jgi:hypothetical protein
MATTFVGVHIVCAFAGANQNQLDILRKPIWSDAQSVAGPTQNTAPAANPKYGEPTIKVRAIGLDAWVTVGASPDDPTSNNSAREFVEAGTEKLFAVDQNDKVRWAPAT